MADFDPYYKWLGIPPAEQPPDHYRLLGLRRFEPDPEVIEAAAERCVAFLQTVAIGQYVAESQRLLNHVAAARRCLLKAESRRVYDSQLRDRQPDAASTPPPAPPPSPPSVSPIPPRLDAPAASGKARHGSGPWSRPLILQLVAGSGFLLVLGLAVLAWGLLGNSPPSSGRVAVRPIRSPAARDSSDDSALKSAGEKAVATPKRELEFKPTAAQQRFLAESKSKSPAGVLPVAGALPSNPVALEPDVDGWRPTRPFARLRVEKGALVLEGTGAATMEFRPVAGPVTIELKAGGDGAGKVRVFWTEIGLPEFTQERSVELELAPGFQWQELSVTLPVAGTLTGLRIDPPDGRRRLELDSVHVHESSGKKIRDWGFGAAAPKKR